MRLYLMTTLQSMAAVLLSTTLPYNMLKLKTMRPVEITIKYNLIYPLQMESVGPIMPASILIYSLYSAATLTIKIQRAENLLPGQQLSETQQQFIPVKTMYFTQALWSLIPLVLGPIVQGLVEKEPFTPIL